MQRSYRWWIFVLAFCGFFADQASKYTVFAQLAEAPDYRMPVLDGLFDLVAQRKIEPDGTVSLYVNQGALFGLGQAAQGKANFVFALVSLLAAGVILFWGNLPSSRRDFRLCISLGMILAGTLGNLYDRLFFGGVRDFLHVFIDRDGRRVFDWPVFNVADCCLVIGAGFLLLQAFQPNPEDKLTAKKAETAPSAAK